MASTSTVNKHHGFTNSCKWFIFDSDTTSGTKATDNWLFPVVTAGQFAGVVVGSLENSSLHWIPQFQWGNLAEWNSHVAVCNYFFFFLPLSTQRREAFFTYWTVKGDFRREPFFLIRRQRCGLCFRTTTIHITFTLSKCISQLLWRHFLRWGKKTKNIGMNQHKKMWLNDVKSATVKTSVIWCWKWTHTGTVRSSSEAGYTDVFSDSYKSTNTSIGTLTVVCGPILRSWPHITDKQNTQQVM